jgi:Ca-activated chloride channel homolog
MRATYLSHAVIAGFLALAIPALADPDNLDLRVSPERSAVFKTKDAEVVFDVNLRGRDITSPRHTPINLALVIDHSGSMEGAKIEKARQAACTAIDQLSTTDTISLVQFDDQVDVLIPAQPVEDKERLKEIVDKIRPGGSTALYDGVQEGARQLHKYFDDKNVNRVILVSDGIANVGPSSPGDMSELGRGLREKGEAVTTVGLGDDYNEDVMASIAEASGANYYYVKDAEKLPGVFEKELDEVKDEVAQNLRIIIEFPDGVDPVEIIGMPDVVFKDNKASITLGSFYASQSRDLMVRCRVHAPDGESADVAKVHIVYAAPGNGTEHTSDAVANVKFTDQQEASDKSVDVTVSANADLAANSASRARVLSLQDADKYKEAAGLLQSQAKLDRAAAAAAPADSLAGQKLKFEAQSLGTLSGQLQNNEALSNDQRKDFQYENYNQANQR